MIRKKRKNKSDIPTDWTHLMRRRSDLRRYVDMYETDHDGQYVIVSTTHPGGDIISTTFVPDLDQAMTIYGTE